MSLDETTWEITFKSGQKNTVEFRKFFSVQQFEVRLDGDTTTITVPIDCPEEMEVFEWAVTAISALESFIQRQLKIEPFFSNQRLLETLMSYAIEDYVDYHVQGENMAGALLMAAEKLARTLKIDPEQAAILIRYYGIERGKERAKQEQKNQNGNAG